jgi:hypothetical protein
MQMSWLVIIRQKFGDVNTGNARVTCAGVLSQDLSLFNESCNIFREGLRGKFDTRFGCIVEHGKNLGRLGVFEKHVFKNEINCSVNPSPVSTISKMRACSVHCAMNEA